MPAHVVVFLASKIIVAFKRGEADPLGHSLEKTIKNFLGINAKSVRTRRAYIINAELKQEEIEALQKNLFVDPVTECSVRDMDNGFDWLVEVGYKPGVTDPVGRSAAIAVNQAVKENLDLGSGVATATQYLISGVSRDEIERIAKGLLSNPVIEDVRILSGREARKGVPIPQYQIGMRSQPVVKSYDLSVSDEELAQISKKGVLSLSISEMRTMQAHARKKEFAQGRKKIGMDKEFWCKYTDAELEAVAQTQSEHCKHKIFNAVIDYVDEKGKTEKIDGLFGTYIKGPSKKIYTKYGWVLSAFHDNAGIVDAGNGIVIADKLETHNAPSALEPYGGAITGILGVNRDILGAGMGAEPLFNVFGYCFGDPFYSKGLEGGILHPARIRNGVHRGVIDGGNQSGIPLADGFEIFDSRFGFRPLVYCGTIGIMPKRINKKPSHIKKARPGDLIVMVGGRIGKDGIHGATFSSAELDKASPVQAVQIGDSITQKKMTDFLIEARDLGLYTCITDDGAGGLSSSVGEMAKDTGGCMMDLRKAPLKYSGLMPWEILISESQERMTVAVDPAKSKRFLELAKKRDVEATVLGEFNNSGKLHVAYGDKIVAYLDMDFLHDGFPRMELHARWSETPSKGFHFEKPSDLDKVLMDMLGRLNVCSREYKMRQYDHEVKGLSIVKPFVGKDMDVASDATVSLITNGGMKGIIVAHGINPRYSDIDAYHMAASAIDEAIRRIIAAGGRLPDKDNVMYGLDNFCWNISSLDGEDAERKMAQLVRANKALAHYCEAFAVPCISGKDSMKKVWRMKDSNKTVSIPATLLFSARAIIKDVSKAVTMDVKNPGDLVYVVGNTYDELGASEYLAYIGDEIGNNVPKVDAKTARRTYEALSKATRTGLVSSIHTPTIGGLAVALAQCAFAGGYGMEIDLRKVPYLGERRDDYVLFSQSNSRFIVTIPKNNRKRFEQTMKGVAYAQVGVVSDGNILKIKGLDGRAVVNSGIDSLKSSWKRTLEGV